MDAAIDTRNPIGKLDFDTEDRNLPAQHYRYGKNGRSGTSDKDGDGAVENIRGNVLRDASYTNKGRVIGSCPDVKNNAVIYFVCGVPITITYVSAFPFPAFDAVTINSPNRAISVGDILQITQGSNVSTVRVTTIILPTYFFTYISGALNADPITDIKTITENFIERYYDSTGSFENLTNPTLMGLVLNFSTTNRIFNPRVIESSFGQLLAWTDGVNPPRLMDIDKMKQGGDYYNIANNDQFINLGKQPPLVTPLVQFLTSNTPPTTYFINYFYQFRYRYVYYDGSISSMSDISDVALTDSDFSLIENYAIQVTINTGPQIVKYIEILTREGNGVSDGSTNPEWYIFKTINKAADGVSDNISYNVNFFNNESKTPVSKIDSDVNFYSLPQLAGSLEVVNNSQIVLANVTEGYDNVAVTGTITEKKVFGFLTCNAITDNIMIPNFITDYEILHPIYACVYIPLAGGQSIFGPLDTSSFSNFYNSLITQWNALPGFIATILFSSSSQVVINFSPSIEGVQFSYKLTADSPLVEKGVKTNSVVPVGIVYYDNFLRSTGVNVLNNAYQEGDNINLITNTLSVQALYGILYNIPRLLITNTTTAPSWATKYKIVVKESNIGTFMQTAFTIVSSKIRLSTVWSFSVGDRVRWNELNTTTGDVILRDYTIISYDISNNELNLGDVNPAPTSGYVVTPNIVEVYTPNNSAIWFETDKLYNASYASPIVFTGNSYFAVFKISGDVGTTAQLFGTLRNEPTNFAYSLGGTTIVNNRMTVTDKFGNYWWKGRVNIETPTARQLRIGTLLRWSGLLINNTQVNNLNVFDSGNYNNDVNARFGDITGLRQIGYTLKILQWANINSAFLGRREVQNADGSTQLVVTDNLIGTINPSEMEYGTKYPGSIISTGRRLYFYDSIKSRMIVDDGNGINEVAMYMGVYGAPSTTMSKYFRAKSSVINADSNYQIITGFDYLYRDLYISFVNYTLNTEETLYYNEGQDAWKYFMDMESMSADGLTKHIIDCYGWVGQSSFGFLQANTYQFNKLLDSGNPKYSTLFKIGSDDPLKPLVVETIGMIEPDKVKIMQSNWIHCNKPIELVEITIPANTMYPNGMYTVLKPGNFDYREGVFYAQIKNDMYTNGIPSTDAQRKQAIVNGRKMRGHVCLVRITYLTDDYVKLYSTGISMIPSEMS